MEIFLYLQTYLRAKSLLKSLCFRYPHKCSGAAIAVRLDRFSLSKLNIAIPSSIEIVWGLLRPKVTTGRISTIIVSSFYCPPKSRKKSILIDHMTETLQSFLKIHINAGVIISGEGNDLEISSNYQLILVCVK